MVVFQALCPHNGAISVAGHCTVSDLHMAVWVMYVWGVIVTDLALTRAIAEYMFALFGSCSKVSIIIGCDWSTYYYVHVCYV